MRFHPHRPPARRTRRLLFKAALSLAILAVLVLALGGCKLFMPAEIKGIVRKLDLDTVAFESDHPGASHNYTFGTRPMHYVEVGTNGVKPLVLFIHGSPGDWNAWVDYLNDTNLSARARMIAVDRPGFGGSGAGKAERSLVAQCNDIAPLLDHVSPGQRVILVGHSFGGPVACRLAMDHPDKVTDLIILAGSIDPAEEHTKWYQYPAEWWIFRWLVPRELVTVNREIRALKGGLTEMLPLWKNIHQRVTVIQGGADKLVPPENADFAQRVMTNAQPLDVIRLPGANHFLPWNKSQLVKSEIIKHLQ